MFERKRVPRCAAKILLWLAVPVFAACGGGGGGGGGSPPPPVVPPPVTATGVFIDSPVAGLGYRSGNATASTTDAQGFFVYTVGETLSFSIGGVQLGTLPDGQARVTPYDFGAAAENIARLLQTLDADGNPLNGIDLAAAATALANVTFDASGFVADATTFEAAIQPVLDAALGAGATLIDATTAIANLDAALDTTFDVAELADRVLVIDLPSIGDKGFVVFDPLANAGDSGSSLELILLSDTLDAGGFGSTTELDWAVDGGGALLLSDPFDASFVIVINKLGGGNVMSISLTDGVDEIVGSFLVPVSGVAADLSGDFGRSFDLATASGTERLTFFADGTFTQVVNDLTAEGLWSLAAGGSLLSTTDANNQVTLSVLLDGSLVTGGETLTFTATNLSGDPAAPVYDLVAMFPGSLVPVSFPDPSTAIGYAFTTGTVAISPLDPTLQSLFDGTAVSGSFSYANWAPAYGVSGDQAAPGSVIYAGAVLDLTGTANGLAFGGATGFAVVGNDRYANAGGVDLLMLGDTSLDAGFEIGDYRLIAVRWFWIETDTTPDDFLASDLLPATLPEALTGRLALDFELISDPQTTISVFFDGFTLTPAP